MPPSVPRCFQTLESQECNIPAARKSALEHLATLLTPHGKLFPVVFVCTHNSRRSQLAELWLRSALIHYGLDSCEVYSAGTEATAFNPRMVQALRRAGFTLELRQAGDNPVYIDDQVSGSSPVEMFSKTLGHPSLPEQGFAAVMVCDDADRNCPWVPGARVRFALPYSDPKEADGTDGETAAYAGKVEEIGREMIYLARLLKNLIS